MYLPLAGAPEDETERRQMRATYHGAQKEVDDQLARLFDHLDASGLADSTLVVLTSDHGEMGGDHWLFEKLGYWDESFHVPLIVRDPDPAASAAVGAGWSMPSPSRWTCSHHLPLARDRGAAAGGRLRPAAVHHRGGRGTGRRGRRTHWRTEAHWSWNFSNPATRAAERLFGLPMAHCALDVVRGSEVKYVQFAADAAVLPPLLFDLEADPGQLHDLASSGGASERGWQAAQRLMQWRMRNDDRTLTGTMLTRGATAVGGRPGTSGGDRASRRWRRLSPRLRRAPVEQQVGKVGHRVDEVGVGRSGQFGPASGPR